MRPTKEELRKEYEESIVPELMIEEQENIAQNFTTEELKEIDNIILSEASVRRRKVARIIGHTMNRLKKEPYEISEIFYLSRLILLVEKKKLIGYGNLRSMRFSEVKLVP